MSKIISLQAENIKRLKAVHIEPNSAVVVVGGKENQGKSSVLDSIMYALAGQKSIPSKPLRNGTKKGKITLDLGELIVERSFHEGKTSQLVVKSKDGYEAPTPQKILDDMCGKLAFDPLAFSREKPKDQLAIMRDLVGLDFSGLDGERAKCYAERTGVNRDLKQLEGELAALEWYDDAPEGEVSVADLGSDLERASEVNANNGRKRRFLEATQQTVDAKGSTLGDLIKEREELDAKIKRLESDLATARDGLAKLITEAKALEDVDLEPIRARMKSCEVNNAKVRANAKYTAVQGKVKAAKQRAEAMSERIEAIDEEKATLVSGAKFPVVGLGFDDDGITFNGLPFEQAASSQRLRVSAAMGLAMNPELRVMLIRDGSLMGEESLALLAEMAAEHDAQVWVERVSSGEEVSVVIEDGMVKEDRMAEHEEAVAAE